MDSSAVGGVLSVGNLVSAAVAPLRNSEAFVDFLVNFSNPALQQCRQTICEMARLAIDGVGQGTELTRSYSDGLYRDVEHMEEVCDRCEDGIGTYLARISRQGLDPAGSAEATLYYHLLSDFERISDDAMCIARVANQACDEKQTYSEAAYEELSVLQRAIGEALERIYHAFERQDLAEAEEAIALSLVADDLCEELHLRHIGRLRKGDCSQEQGLSYNDLLTYYEQIVTRCRKIADMVLSSEDGEFDFHAYHARLNITQRQDLLEKAVGYREQYAVREV